MCKRLRPTEKGQEWRRNVCTTEQRRQEWKVRQTEQAMKPKQSTFHAERSNNKLGTKDAQDHRYKITQAYQFPRIKKL